MINFHHKKLSICVDLILMDFLYERLPKDLVNIIEEYAKDRTNYDKVLDEFNDLMSDAIESNIKNRWINACATPQCFHFVIWNVPEKHIYALFPLMRSIINIHKFTNVSTFYGKPWVCHHCRNI
jgi:hypothetical protein